MISLIYEIYTLCGVYDQLTIHRSKLYQAANTIITTIFKVSFANAMICLFKFIFSPKTICHMYVIHATTKWWTKCYSLCMLGFVGTHWPFSEC